MVYQTLLGDCSISKLAQEHGKDGITVNTILTGGVATERFESLVKKQVQSTGKTFEEIMNTVNETIPRGCFIPRRIFQIRSIYRFPRGRIIDGNSHSS